jgi:phospholipid/cholesterol/gamma-HCH transport system permease protein
VLLTERLRRTTTIAISRPIQGLAALGRQLGFYVGALLATPRATRRYGSEVKRLVAEVALGRGALAVIGGSLVVITANDLIVGAELGLLGFTTLQPLGLDVLTGFVGGYFSTREIAPIIAAFAFTSVVGAGFTAQIGAMRINEEIDALEVMAVRPVAYLVSTRISAGLISIIPLYATALIFHYAALKFMVTFVFGQSSGSYQHYFGVFLLPQDVLISFVKTIAMALVIIMIQCYYGFNATGGPAGVGVAVGRGVRNSLIAALFVDLIVGLAFFGPPNSIRIAV